MLNRKMSPEEAIERIEIILKNSKFTQADKLALKSAISAFAYINQLEAEVERLTNKCDDCAGCTQWKCDCANIESEAIKEFAGRLKNEIVKELISNRKSQNEIILSTHNIDESVKYYEGKIVVLQDIESFIKKALKKLQGDEK